MLFSLRFRRISVSGLVGPWATALGSQEGPLGSPGCLLGRPEGLFSGSQAARRGGDSGDGSRVLGWVGYWWLVRAKWLKASALGFVDPLRFS